MGKAKEFPPKSKPTERSIRMVKNQFKYPQQWCQFWLNDKKNTSSPIKDVNAKQMYPVCRQLLKPATSTTRSSSSQTSTTTSTTTTTTLMSSSTTAVPTTITTTSITTQEPSISSTLTSSATTIRMTTTTARACGADPTAALVAIADSKIVLTDVKNLVPSENIILYYAQPAPGTLAAQLKVDMYRQTVDLSSSSLISNVACTSNELSFTSLPNAVAAIDAWPSRMTLITQHTSCNKLDEKGLWMVENIVKTTDGINVKYSFTAKTATWAEAADTMDISYGERKIAVGDSDFQSASPGACHHRFFYNYLHHHHFYHDERNHHNIFLDNADDDDYNYKHNYINNDNPNDDNLNDNDHNIDHNNKHDNDNDNDDDHYHYHNCILNSHVFGSAQSRGEANRGVTPSNFSKPEINAADWKPDDATLQDALEDKLQAAGLDPPDFFKKDADKAIEPPVCLARQNKRDLFDPSSGPIRALQKRFGWDDVWDIGCSDLVGAFTGDVGDLARAGKDIYDNRLGMHVHRLLLQSARSSSADIPVRFPVLMASQVLLQSKHQGRHLGVILKTGQILGAKMSVSEKSKAAMVLGLKTSGPLSYNWNTKVSSIALDAITVSGVFRIDPEVIFSLGAEFSTTKPVDITAGATMVWGQANADIDMSSISATNIYGWDPSLQVTQPVFKTSAVVKIYPYMRRLYEISFSVLGSKISSKATFTSQTAITFDTEYNEDTAVGSCRAGQLRLVSYASNKQNLVFGNGAYRPLNALSKTQPEKRFDVPSERPSADEIAQLRSTAGEFCTSYNYYYAPRIASYTTGVVPRDTYTSTISTSTVTTTPTTTETTGTTILATQIVYTATTTQGTATGTAALSAKYQKRHALVTKTSPAPEQVNSSPPVTGAVQQTSSSRVEVHKRAVATPALVATWDATKIRYACSQVATGSITLKFTTAYRTEFTSTITNTLTAYTVVGGLPITRTFTTTDYSWTTTTSYNSTVSLDAACPLQTQGSCFKILGSGYGAISAKELGLRDEIGQASFDVPGSTFYLACDKSLVALPDVRALVNHASGLLDFQTFDSTTSSSRLQCELNSVTKEVTCASTSGDTVLYGYNPQMPYWKAYFRGYTARPDVRQDAPCSCGDAAATDVAIYEPTNPACPAADNTTFTSTSGSVYQIQCSTSYIGSPLTQTTMTTLTAGINSCGADPDCIASSWNPLTNACKRMFTINSAPTTVPPSSAQIHSFIRVLYIGPSNLILNPTFEGTGSWIGASNDLVMPRWTPNGANIRYVLDADGVRTVDLFISGSYANFELKQTVAGLATDKYYRLTSYVDPYCAAGSSATFHHHQYQGASDFRLQGPLTATGLYKPYVSVFRPSGGTADPYNHLFGGTSGGACGVLLLRVTLYGPYDTEALARA
ncbi:hypothetical protein KVT40_005542 [Elsinoe batatas]|uniref:DUF7029 domain-containing protein n=1 Tax=Elsinoe batatas TaxID=2601811 RepID=A0A8K0PFI5_9PEZI|nr:hypothetical protein KVT40_005542 [Elsinoe batatas]